MKSFLATLALGTLLLGCAANDTQYNAQTNASIGRHAFRDDDGNIWTDPILVYSEQPIFPPGPRSRPGKFNLKITATFVVNPDGIPIRIEIIKSDDPFYNPLVIEAVKKWKFKPATMNGIPCEQRMQLPFSFELVD